MSIPYRYTVELERNNGEALGQFPVDIDWEPARQAACLTALRRSRSAAFDELQARPMEIAPVWEENRGEPYVGAVRVGSAVSGDAVETGTTISTTYFADYARGLATRLVTDKVLEQGELYRYGVTAYVNGQEAEASPSPGLEMECEQQAPELRVRDSDFSGFRESSFHFGTRDESDFPVVCPWEILDETTRLTRQAEAKETGGILIGHLCRDETGGDIFAQVTDQIPAIHNEEKLMSLTFTPETWSTVQRAIQLRGQNELWLGWWHSHPAKYWCNPKCPAAARKACPLKTNFFSSQDVTLHRSVFPWAHCLALVITHIDDGVEYAMFGWRNGSVAQRGFWISHGSSDASDFQPREAILTPGAHHEKQC